MSLVKAHLTIAEANGGDEITLEASCRAGTQQWKPEAVRGNHVHIYNIQVLYIFIIIYNI